MEQINNFNRTNEVLTTMCDYGFGLCIPEADVNSPERESYLKPLFVGQTPIDVSLEDYPNMLPDPD